ncbi:tyrosine-type recombinase/integrase [Roseateles chitinivorans]|uniref:tyrosine-type recombinase/integrase n=1 Tax=Roseateles chitinivorans TaxID=2917965 RepID=UPI003D6683AA
MNLDVISLEGAAMRWREACAHLSPATQAAYSGEIKRLLEYCAKAGATELGEVTRQDWDSYLAASVGNRGGVDSRRRPALKTSSALQAARITRAFFRYCAGRRWLAWQPEPGSYRGAPQSHESPTIAAPDLGPILTGSGQDDDEHRIRIRCAIGLAFWGGLRPKEIARLRRSDLLINQDGSGALQVAWREQEVLLPPCLVEHLECYFRRRLQRGSEVSAEAALICSLRSEIAISASAAWRLLKAWPTQNASSDSRQLGGRSIRAGFIALATPGVSESVGAIEHQLGRPQKTRGTPPSPSQRERMIRDLHAQLRLQGQ